MNSLKNLNIQPIENGELRKLLQHNIDQKTKPVGSLGYLEELALRIGLIQESTRPELKSPVMLTVASDHGITEEGVSPVPPEITWQQVNNFINGGGGIGLFCKQYGFDLYVVDAGVDHDFEPHPRLIDKKVRKATRNFLKEPAMTQEECDKAIQNGRDVVALFAEKGSNVVGFGEMGIGNSSPATALLSVYTGLSLEECTGPGCGLDQKGIQKKSGVLQQAIEKHGILEKPEANLAAYGGLEIATMVGGMLEAAQRRMLIVVDGFITTSAFLAAYEICPTVRDYAVFSHCSKEHGHVKMLNYMNGRPLLNLDLRLGEGTGSAIAYPIIQGSVAMLNEMTSFGEAKVYNVVDETGNIVTK
ncbi:nicotinate-nucleotide--dimethylbenzimidazole phosphoribosyltransferase [Marinilabilia salmonicolor]|jgi:nicotinate-nucleotide--dimethylbenzimidazole phosphoribosyltransferase|uniref:Nicotinate-nucleotide--dimethylbenzimidazole phosphoribosyltransferase n=1 Tax=Marinilabilia salmonicolor TaxID=989 RepID=A0A2T0XBA7_9BACT|nr:nicotinate-nucleotide--dimethylbenzimidazole phosphoribosyltransferase [Marinilabilia salmonicolor]PRY96215.1 nicotinate-nucleotide-dimethylbenzimidazole phosphoribosyltransferase [Marinilabilia salmonicolor]RCW35309.1 nicotinate-nucleotide-dimethylbenzimidazole phosphoribosyltransferase [Marinilabilia salmonicolor]